MSVNTKNTEISELSDRSFKAAVIKVLKISVTKTVGINEKNKMLQQRNRKHKSQMKILEMKTQLEKPN